MCGIGGIIVRKGVLDEETVEGVRLLSEVLQSRGTDAYGFIVINEDGSVRKLFKIGAPASQVWECFGDILKEWMIGAKAVLLHTRATTSGSEKYNKNNHPFNIGSWYLAHNGFAGRSYGGYYVYDSKRKTYIYKRRDDGKFDSSEPETDSYRYLFKPLVEILNGWWRVRLGTNEIIEALNKVWDKYGVHGSIWLYNEDLKKAYIFRGEKELELRVTDEFIAFASEGLPTKEKEELKTNTLIEYDFVNDKVMRWEDLGIASEYSSYSYGYYRKSNNTNSNKKEEEAIQMLEAQGFEVKKRDKKYIIIDSFTGYEDWTYDIVAYVESMFGVRL